MRHDTILTINANIGKAAAANAIGTEEKIKASMRAVLTENWLEKDDNKLFQAAVAGVLTDVGITTPEGEKIIRSHDALKKLTAYFAAAQAGLSIDPKSALPDGEVFSLLRWWHEIQAEIKR